MPGNAAEQIDAWNSGEQTEVLGVNSKGPSLPGGLSLREFTWTSQLAQRGRCANPVFLQIVACVA